MLGGYLQTDSWLDLGVKGPLNSSRIFNDTKCILQDMPIPSADHELGVGGIINGLPVYCGGQAPNGTYYGDCFQLAKNGNWMKLGSLNMVRTYMTAVSVNDEFLWIIGGKTGPSFEQLTNTTEIIYANGTVIFGPELPHSQWIRCPVMTDTGHIYILGFNETLVFKYEDQELTYSHEAPALPMPLEGPACSAVYSRNHNGRQVIIFSSGLNPTNGGYSAVQLLDYSIPGATWTHCKILDLLVFLFKTNIFSNWKYLDCLQASIH